MLSKPNRRLTVGSGRLSLFRTIETRSQNRMEQPVNRQLGFEAVSKATASRYQNQISSIYWYFVLKCKTAWNCQI